MMKSLQGLWVLEGSNPPLYTDVWADEVVDKRTGKKYKLGERKIFRRSEGVPEKVEDTGNYEFLKRRGKKELQPLSERELLQDIRAGVLFGKIF